MPLALAGLVIGAIWGAMRARNRGGARADMVQWGAVHAMALGLAGLFAALIIYRLSA